jgi:hypothetical protein
MNAKKHEWKVESSRNWLRLFFRLGILAQGELQQPAERFGPRFKSVVEPEIFNLSEQVLFQAQQYLFRWPLGWHWPEIYKIAPIFLL